MEIGGHIEGLDALVRELKKRGENVASKGLSKGVNAACDVVVGAAQAALHTATDHRILRESLGKKVKRYRKNETVVGIVGARTGFKRQIGVRKRDGKKSKKGDPIFEDPSNLAHLVEFGHGGPHPAPPHPFLRPAFDSSKGAQADAISTAVQAELQ